MVSTYHLVKLLQNANPRRVNRKKSKQPDTSNIKPVTPAPKVLLQTCRVCLQPGIVPIFSNTITYDFPIPYYLKIICDIVITFNDISPQYLCKSCLDILDAAIKLRNTAKESQLKLREVSYQNLHSFENTDVDTAYKYEVPVLSLLQKKEDTLPKLEVNRERTSFKDTAGMKYKPDALKIPPQQRIDSELKNEHEYEKYYRQVFTKENKPAYECQICKKIYSRSSRADHLIIHFPDSAYQYVCEVCGKTFKKYCVFHQHQKIHIDVLPYKCHLCQYKGRTNYQVQGHIKRTHNMKEYSLQCPLCPKKFYERNSSFRHHLARHGEPKYQCPICQKLFYEKSTLEEHNKIIHLSETKLHECGFCGNSYKRRKNLLVHEIKVHKRKKVLNHRAIYLKLDNILHN